MKAPDLWIIAGPNGAGKTTLMSRGVFSRVVPMKSMVNPDDITFDYLKAEGIHSWEEAPLATQTRLFIKAAEEAQRRLEERVEKGQVAVVESVLSTRKYVPLVERTIELGGRFYFIYVILNSPTLSRIRVTARADSGGHDVPSDKLERRWHDSLEIAPWFAARARRFWVVDNSDPNDDSDPVRVLYGERGRLTLDERGHDAAVDAIAFRFLRGVAAHRPEGIPFVL